MQSIKTVIVGSGGTGKTAMLISYSTNVFSKEYIPTIFDNFSKNVMFEGRPINLALWDTAGQEEYDRVRPLSYHNTDVVIVTFDLTMKKTVQDIHDKWYPEVRHFLPGVPIILVGNKQDLRDFPTNISEEVRKSVGFGLVSTETGMDLAKEINATKYVECSSLTQVGLEDVFESAIRVVLHPPKKKKKKNKACSIM